MSKPKVNHHTLIWIIAILVAILVGFIIVSFIFRPTVEAPVSNIQPEQSKPSLPYTATFQVVINGQKRSFNYPMYLNQSKAVYIDPGNSEQVVVNEESITWSEFFSTLPFKVEQDCIVTGNKETYCSNPTQKLTFTLNGQAQADVLNREIQPKDNLIISY